MYVSHDFVCPECGFKFDDLVPRGNTTTLCQECGETAAVTVSAPSLGFMNDPNRRAAALKKRSEEHSVKQARANPEALAAKLKAKPRVQNAWNVRTPKKA